MIRIPFAAALLASLASPALAHEGAHLHPHDGGLWLGLAVVLAGLGLYVLRRLK